MGQAKAPVSPNARVSTDIGCKETELTPSACALPLASMKQIELKEVTELAPHLCQRCGGLMRLIGSEPHPVEVETDLLTFCCTACDEFLVLPIESWANL